MCNGKELARTSKYQTLTWKVPWLALVEIDVGDGTGDEGEVGDLAAEVVSDELLVRRVEPEARRQHGRVGHDHRHATRARAR